MTIAILLAAGAGSRFDGPTAKLRAPLRGKPVVTHALEAVVASGLDVIVVTGAVDLSDLIPPKLTVVHNPDWAAGQATSVRAGIGVARSSGHDAVVVGLGDQPFVTPEAWRAVSEGTAPIAVATYDGRRGNPVRLSAEVWPLLPESGDAVGRALMSSRPELVGEIPCQGDSVDIDTEEDLQRWS